MTHYIAPLAPHMASLTHYIAPLAPHMASLTHHVAPLAPHMLPLAPTHTVLTGGGVTNPLVGQDSSLLYMFPAAADGLPARAPDAPLHFSFFYPHLDPAAPPEGSPAGAPLLRASAVSHENPKQLEELIPAFYYDVARPWELDALPFADTYRDTIDSMRGFAYQNHSRCKSPPIVHAPYRPLAPAMFGGASSTSPLKGVVGERS